MTFRLTALSPHTGAEITGIDLTKPVDDATRTALNRAFIDHHVLVFRDQKMTAQQLLDAVQLFGRVFPQHNARHKIPDCPMVHYISNQEFNEDGTRHIPGEGYHTDHSNDAHPPKATVLHAVTLPDDGGDTQFVNMYEAYDALPEATKRRIADLKAIHVFQSRHSKRKLMTLSNERKAIVPDAVTHPIARPHTETGRKSIFINPIRIEGIVGMEEIEALKLLDELLEFATQEKFQYRHKWHSGDMVMWDNRCLLHKANGDYDMSQVRYLYRVMLQDEVAAGTNEKARLSA